MRLLLIIIAIIFMTNSQSFYKMIVTLGTPQSFTTYSSLSLDWEDCLNYCLISTNCIVVSNQTASKCLLFALGQIKTVNQTNTGVIVGFKVRSNETSCPITDDAPIVGGSPGTGGIPDNSNTRNQTYQPYTVKSSAGLWTIVQEKKLYCDIGSHISERALGPWCLSIVSSSGCIDQAKAANNCLSSKTLGNSVLSGIESLNEYNIIKNRANTMIASFEVFKSYKTVGYWISGTRKAECKTPNNDTVNCNGINEFSITDPAFTGPGYYDWLPGQPSGMNTNPTTKNCLEIKFTSTSIGIDDVACSTSKAANLCQWGFVCGKKPS